MKIIRRRIRHPGDDPDPPATAGPEEWMEIYSYPGLELEPIRGARVFRTKHAPLRYRIVINAYIDRQYRVPAVIAIENERSIRFGNAKVEFGVMPRGERKVESWHASLPKFRNKDVILSNPDFVLLSTPTLVELGFLSSTTDDR